MISRNNLLPTLLLVIAAVTLVNCAPAVPCNVVGSGGGAARLHRFSASDICGNSGGGGGGTPTCSMTAKPTQVMLSVDITGAVVEYGIDSTTGALTLLCNTAPAAFGQVAASANNFLYVLDTTTNPQQPQIFAFIIAHNLSGALGAVTGSPFKLSDPILGASSIVADPLGRFMFVTNHDNNDVHVLTIASSGALSEATNSPFTISFPDHIAITPSGAFAYVPDSHDGDIFILSLSSTGQLVNTPVSPLIIPNFEDVASFAIVHPNGNFLLTADLSSVASYAIDATVSGQGGLTLVGGLAASTSAAQVQPLSIALDGTGKFLYVTPNFLNAVNGNNSPNIVGFAVDTVGGGLTSLPNSPFISTATLDVLPNPMGTEAYVFSELGLTTQTPTINIFTAPIDVMGNLTIPSTSVTTKINGPPVIVNIQ
jgi:6-phosphogluconolactonase (cycloisomerase 2 family)